MQGVNSTRPGRVHHPPGPGRLRGRGALYRASAVLAVIAALLAGLGSGPAGASAMGLKGMWGPAFQDGRSLFPTYRALGVGVYQDVLRWNLIARRAPRHSTNPNDPRYVWPKEVTRAVAEANR